MKPAIKISLGLLTAFMGLTLFQNCGGFKSNYAQEISSSSNTTLTPATTTPPTGSSKVVLAWQAPTVVQQTGFSIEQSTDNKTFAPVLTVAATATTATVTGLAKGVTYYFRVQSVNQGGGSTYTQTVTASIPN